MKLCERCGNSSNDLHSIKVTLKNGDTYNQMWCQSCIEQALKVVPEVEIMLSGE